MYIYIFTNILEGTAFLFQGLTHNDVELSDSVAFVQPTRPSHSAPMNLLTIFTNVAKTAISFNGKYNDLKISHGQKHLRPMTLPHWTNQNVFPSLSPTTQPFVPSHPLFVNTFTSLFHPLVAITS